MVNISPLCTCQLPPCWVVWCCTCRTLVLASRVAHVTWYSSSLESTVLAVVGTRRDGTPLLVLSLSGVLVAGCQCKNACASCTLAGTCLGRVGRTTRLDSGAAKHAMASVDLPTWLSGKDGVMGKLCPYWNFGWLCCVAIGPRVMRDDDREDHGLHPHSS